MMRIVCPTDFSESAERAVRQAASLAKSLGAEVVLVHVASEAQLWREGVMTPALRRVFEAQRKWAADALAERVVALAAEGTLARSVVRAGAAWEEIVRVAAEEHADMIVMGTQGRTGLERFMLGSVAERVIRRAPCPVLTLRPDTKDTEDTQESGGAS
jgi:nucleotide-binding universal stress UspA family protein